MYMLLLYMRNTAHVHGNSVVSTGAGGCWWGRFRILGTEYCESFGDLVHDRSHDGPRVLDWTFLATHDGCGGLGNNRDRIPRLVGNDSAMVHQNVGDVSSGRTTSIGLDRRGNRNGLPAMADSLLRHGGLTCRHTTSAAARPGLVTLGLFDEILRKVFGAEEARE